MHAMKRVLSLTNIACSVALLTAASSTAALAQEGMAGMHDGEKMPAMHGEDSSSASPAVQAYTAANNRMHQAMTSSYSGNPDIDFARGMIPHHQGAIDMAKIELKYGTDPQLRILAKQVINAQEAEIETLKSWLKTHDKPSP